MIYPESVKQAREETVLHYLTGKPCKHGHIALRLTSDRSCMECNKIKSKANYHANSEEMKAKRRSAYAANPEPEKVKARIRSAEWRNINPNHEGTKVAKKAYAASDQGKLRKYISTAKRRAAKLERTPKWLTEIDFERIENEYKLATLLSKVTGSPWHVDHVIPLQGKFVSGLHVPSNLQVLRGSENVAKANKFLPKG